MPETIALILPIVPMRKMNSDRSPATAQISIRSKKVIRNVRTKDSASVVL